ncbi:hypothetical protein GQ457_05G031890 [Hibiscus cannabinus]
MDPSSGIPPCVKLAKTKSKQKEKKSLDFTSGGCVTAGACGAPGSPGVASGARRDRWDGHVWRMRIKGHFAMRSNSGGLAAHKRGGKRSD